MYNNKTFFIADTHFGDPSIFNLEARPFMSVHGMDEMLIQNWNNTVGIADDVFVLGDFSFYDLEKTADICKRLNGNKYLIMGNHDTESERDYINCGFVWASKFPIIFNSFFVLSHEPLYVNKFMAYANIFGHVHNNPNYKSNSSHGYCVCVERTDYRPVDFMTIKEIIAKNNMQ